MLQLSPTGNAGDAIFRGLMFCAALLILLIVGGMIVALALKSLPAIRQFGISFLTTQQWNPIKNEFGALPFIFGTLVSSALALLIAIPLGIGVAIFLSELAPRHISDACAFLIELLAAIPRVLEVAPKARFVLAGGPPPLSGLSMSSGSISIDTLSSLML